MTEAVVLQDMRIDPDRFLLRGIDTTPGPGFSTSQVAKVFFARSSHWLLLCEREHKNVLDGDPKCRHYEMKSRILRTGDKPRSVESISSWVQGGVCKKCGGRRVGMRRTATGSRVYYLGDVEELVHAFTQNGRIDGAQTYNALLVVSSIARVHDYIS